MAYSLSWLADVLRDAGLKVAEQPGWQTRGLGDAGTPRGVMCHHTATPACVVGNMPTLGLVTHGRPDLRGPLSQLGLGRDGTFYVIAAGRAQHAGRGAWNGVDTGNTSFIGIEAEHSGLPDEPWPAVQIDAYQRGVAAILARIGGGATMCCGHKEFAQPAGRKCDPSFDMVPFRTAVAALMTGRQAPRPAIPANDTQNRPTLRRGGRGPVVAQLQTALRLDADGVFGAQTEAAVRAFQRGRNLVPDGIVGPRCWAAIDTLEAEAQRSIFRA